MKRCLYIISTRAMETSTILSYHSQSEGVLSVYAIEYGLRVQKLNHQIKKLEADPFYIKHPGEINLYKTLRDRAQTDLELIEQKIAGLRMVRQREEEDAKQNIEPITISQEQKENMISMCKEAIKLQETILSHLQQ